MIIIPKNKTLLQEMRALLRRQGYAYGTENTYCDWARRVIFVVTALPILGRGICLGVGLRIF
jgi:hypothetical protein